MPAQISPFVDAKFGAPLGENGWNVWMDENLLKFSFLFDRNVDAIVSSLPPIVNGEAYFLDSENRLYFAVQGLWYSSPVPKWFEFVIKSTGEVYRFNGNTVSIVESTENFEPRLEAVEITLSQLGSAAYSNVEDFVTPSNLDIVNTQAKNYTDGLAERLSNPTGASLIGYGLGTLDIALNNISTRKTFVSPFQHGAAGNGEVDDSAAVSAAIIEAQTLNLPINLEGGTFLCGRLTSTGVDIYSPSGGGFLLAEGAEWLIDITAGSRDVYWRGFTFDGANQPTGRAFRFNSARNIRFSDINLRNWTQRVCFFESGIRSALIEGGVVRDITAPDVYCFKGSQGKFTGIHFLNCTQHVIRFGYFNNDPAVSSVGNSVIGCSFENIGNDPILYELGARRGVVSSNTFRSCRRIVKVESSVEAGTQDFIISNNMFTTQIGVQGEAIRLINVIRSTVVGNHIDGSYQGITVGAQCRVSDNYIRNISDFGIGYSSQCAIIGNTLDAVSGDGIKSQGATSNRVTILGNTLTSNVQGVGINSAGADTVITGNSVQSVGPAVRLISSSANAVVTGNNFRGAGALLNSSSGSVVANNVT